MLSPPRRNGPEASSRHSCSQARIPSRSRAGPQELVRGVQVLVRVENEKNRVLAPSVRSNRSVAGSVPPILACSTGWPG